MLLPDGSTATTVVDQSGVQTVIVKRRYSFSGDAVPEPSTLVAPFTFYIPHTARHPETVAAAPSNAIWVDVGQSPIAYFAALLNWWSKAETFVVLEHDVVCRPDVLESFAGCSEPWCLYNYAPECTCGNPDCREAWRNALGCTRFRSELMEAVPDAMSSIPPDNWDWHNVCDGLGNNLRAAGFTHHWHEPAVYHHCKIGRDGCS